MSKPTKLILTEQEKALIYQELQRIQNTVFSELDSLRDEILSRAKENGYDGSEIANEFEIYKEDLDKARLDFVEEGLMKVFQSPKPLKPQQKKQVRFAQYQDLEQVRYFDKDASVSSQMPVLESNLDRFNFVARGVNLTQQNIDALLRIALKKYHQEKTDEEIDELIRTQFSMAYLPFDEKDESLDYSLRDAVLNFLGQDPPQKKATILVGLGEINQQNALEAQNGHWFCLNLERRGNKILAYTIDSLGVIERASVNRIIAKIPQTQIEDVLEKDEILSDLNLRALQQIPQLKFQTGYYDCDRQKGVDCGYHAVFNALLVHFGYGSCDGENLRILQDGKQVKIDEFISQRIKDLQARFNYQEQVGQTQENNAEEAELLARIEHFQVPEIVKSVLIYCLISQEKKPDFLEFFRDVENIFVLRKLIEMDVFVSVELMFLLSKLQQEFLFPVNSVGEKLQEDLIFNYSELGLEDFLNNFMTEVVEYINKNVNQILSTQENQEKLDFILDSLMNPKVIDKLVITDDLGLRFHDFIDQINQENLDALYGKMQEFYLAQENLKLAQELEELEILSKNVNEDRISFTLSDEDRQRARESFQSIFGDEIDLNSEDEEDGERTPVPDYDEENVLRTPVPRIEVTDYDKMLEEQEKERK